LADIVALRSSAARRYGGAPDVATVTSVDVLNSPSAARPLTEMMLSLPADGAVALLIASEDIAKRVSRKPVWITGMGASADRHAFAARKANALEACEVAGAAALKRAGWAAKDADLAEVSGSTVVGELLVLEALGVTAPLKGIGAAGGSVAVNPSGGALPADPIMATGLVRLAHAARALSEPSDYGLKAASKALAHGAGGVGMQTHCVFALEV
ncbi:MAG: 3-ketoacyl-CoA thiolase, partial [Parvularculaceae bacterium]